MKPFRRRKGPKGPYTGNYRCSWDGKDINLRTKDPGEAAARARLLKQGKWDGKSWPPAQVAAAAAVRALDPGADPDPMATEPPENDGGAETPTDDTHDRPPTSPEPAPPSREPSHDREPPSEPLHVAAQAAAEEQHAPERSDQAAEQERAASDELRSIMAELGSTADGQGDLLSGLADGAAAFALWAEARAIEWGINWSLARRKPKTDVRFKAGDLDERSLMRRSLRVGLKAAVVTYFPDFANTLTPPMAIAIGLVGGAVVAVTNGQLVNTKTGQVQQASEVVAEATAAAREATAGIPPSNGEHAAAPA
jgi:hypothetical protein